MISGMRHIFSVFIWKRCLQYFLVLLSNFALCNFIQLENDQWNAAHLFSLFLWKNGIQYFYVLLTKMTILWCHSTKKMISGTRRIFYVFISKWGSPPGGIRVVESESGSLNLGIQIREPESGNLNLGIWI